VPLLQGFMSGAASTVAPHGSHVGSGGAEAPLLSRDGDDSEHGGSAPEIAGTSVEFDRLMEDSVDSEKASPGLEFVAPAAALMMSSQRLDSPQRPLHHPTASPARGTCKYGEQVPAAAGPLGQEGQQPTCKYGLQSMPATSGECGNCGNVYMSDSNYCRKCGLPRYNRVLASSLSSNVVIPGVAEEADELWMASQLGGRLDDIAREMKRSAEHEFALALRTLRSQHSAAAEAQRMKAEASFCQQQIANETLQAENQQLSRKLDLKQRQLKDSLVMLQRARSSSVGRCGLERALCAWRCAAAGAKNDRLNCRLAAKLRRKRLAVLAFGAWRRHAQLTSKDKLVVHERATADMVRAKLFEEMEMERRRMSSEMDRLAKQLEEEARQRAVLQENLKRVFMRGVCALNFEAMTLLSDGTSLTESALPASSPAAASFDWAEFEARTSAASAASSAAAVAALTPGTGQEETKCRSCGNTGMDMFGKHCTCKYGQQAQAAAGPPGQDEAKCRSSGNTGLDMLGQPSAFKYGQQAQASSGPSGQDEAKCRSCGNTGVDMFGKPCTCKFGQQAQAAAGSLDQEDAKCRSCGNTGLDMFGKPCTCKYGLQGRATASSSGSPRPPPVPSPQPPSPSRPASAPARRAEATAPFPLVNWTTAPGDAAGPPGQEEAKCRCCGNTGVDVFGNPCTCEYGQRANSATVPSGQEEVKCRSCGNNGVDMFGKPCTCKYGQLQQAATGPPGQEEARCKSCGNAGVDMFGKPCTCKYGQQVQFTAAPPGQEEAKYGLQSMQASSASGTSTASSPATCGKCGNLFMNDSNFCRKCGARREFGSATDARREFGSTTDDLFNVVDRNQDGRISRSEFRSAVKGGIISVPEAVASSSSTTRVPPSSAGVGAGRQRAEPAGSLPFVNWTSAPDVSQGRGHPKPAHARGGLAKGQRWQSAVAPRGPGVQPRPEVIATVG